MQWILAALFFCVPLVFSHFFLIFGIPIVISGFGAYEGLKIAVLTLFVLVSIFWYLIFSTTSHQFFEYQKGIFITLGTLAGIFGIHRLEGVNSFIEFFGTQPFFLGFYPFFLWSILVILCSKLTNSALRFSLWSSFFALFLVGLYALAQKIGFDPIEYETNFAGGRVFSTIGNPNSLALYYLLFLPIILLGQDNRLRWLVGLAILGMIFMTASLSLFFIACVFFVGALCYAAGAPKWWYIFCFIFLGITGIQWLLMSQGTMDDKYLSFLTRITIWQESFLFLFAHPTTLIWGTPASDLLAYLNEYRSAKLLHYIQGDVFLMHLHNTWLDLLFQFGILGLGGIAYGLKIWYQKMGFESHIIFTLTLFLAILGGLFHHFEVVHWCILILVFFVTKNSKCSTQKIK